MHAGNDRDSVSTALAARIGAAIHAGGGWLPFSRFMAMALYEPGLGYYASGRTVVGRMPEGGSDFVTAPELSPLFGRALAVQVAEALDRSGSDEVLDAMPVQLLVFDGEQWRERGVALAADGSLAWRDRPTALRPPHDGPFPPGMVTEIHAQAEAFVASLAHTLARGAAFFIDYGFPAAEYYHPQRHGGTLMCHRAHQADADPLTDVGEKDITAHVDFTGIALAGQDAGLEVLGYTTQARFLMNCGLLDELRGADARTVANAQKLLTEHEMGELFKVIGFAAGAGFDALGFARGDRSHTL